MTGQDTESIDPEEVDIKRPVPVNPMDEDCVEKMKSWIQKCKEHDVCSSSHAAMLPERVVRISPDPTISPEICLSNATTAEYLAVSYCAGDVESPRFTDLPAKLDVGTLPRTLADAITFARRLGYEYLWARSLCVDQNDRSHWDIDSSKLTPIYGNAALTVAVSEGQDANAGIFHERNVLYSPALGKHKNRYLRLHLLRWNWDIDRSPLGLRAWAKVERMLAPRVLHVTNRQMIWECAAGFKYEASGIIDKHYGSGQIRQTYRKSFVQPFISGSQAHSPIETEAVEEQDRNARNALRLEAWFVCLDEFSKGSLSRPMEKLSAMIPVAKIFDDNNFGEYLAGVWSKDIAFGLAWGRVASLLTPSEVYRAPSWSWASVDGPTSSLATSWPLTMMEDHAKDPTWLSNYEVKLVSHQMILADQACPYGSVVRGSNIVVSGMCIGLMKLAKSLNTEQGFCLNFGMDQSPVFDCSCCLPQPEEVRAEASQNFEAEADHHICMVLMGDAWRVLEEWDQHRGFCDLIILKSCEDAGTFERVGFARVQKEYFGNAKTISETNEIWDNVGWERRELKLI